MKITRLSPFRITAALSAVLLMTVSCGPAPTTTTSPSPKPSAVASPAASATPAPAAHFTYEGEDGPEHWGDLSPAYATCKNGKSQTPIDITTTVKESLAPLQLNYNPTALRLINNGHTIQANYDAGSTMTMGGQTYNLVQFHFHTPSEHTINGKRYDMELHLVHKNAAGDLAVVGILMEKGAASNLLQSLWSNLPDQVNQEKVVSNVMFNIKDSLPADQKYYNYSGSLTTPPCSENVNWILLKAPVTVSADQVGVLEKLFVTNSRPIQPLNGRTVKEGT